MQNFQGIVILLYTYIGDFYITIITRLSFQWEAMECTIISPLMFLCNYQNVNIYT